MQNEPLHLPNSRRNKLGPFTGATEAYIMKFATYVELYPGENGRRYLNLVIKDKAVSFHLRLLLDSTGNTLLKSITLNSLNANAAFLSPVCSAS